MINKYNLILFIISIVTVATSFILQYSFKYTPCELCYLQRYLWMLMIFLSIITMVQGPKLNTNFLKYIISTVLLINLIVSIYHSLIQRNIINALFECTDTVEFSEKFNPNLLLEAAANVKPSCDIDAFQIFNLYIPEYNAILCIILLITTTYVNYKFKKSRFFS